MIQSSLELTYDCIFIIGSDWGKSELENVVKIDLGFYPMWAVT